MIFLHKSNCNINDLEVSKAIVIRKLVGYEFPHVYDSVIMDGILTCVCLSILPDPTIQDNAVSMESKPYKMHLDSLEYH